MMDISIFKELALLFEKNGYSLFLVGGSTRDYLLGKELSDFDCATNASLTEMKVFLGEFEQEFVAYSSARYRFHDVDFDITTMREESGYEDYRHPRKVTFVNDPALDCVRRDFTVNAIYMDKEGTFYDPLQGREDLNNGCLRMIGDPMVRFKEDPLRMLRALRFMIDFNWDLDQNVIDAIRENRFLLRYISYRKVRAELLKIHQIKPQDVRRVLTHYQIDEVLPLFYEVRRRRNVIDLHCDTITVLAKAQAPFIKNSYHIDLNKLQRGEYFMQTFAIFLNQKDGNLYQNALNYIEYFHRTMKEHIFFVEEVRCLQDLINVKNKEKTAALLSLEEGGALEGNLSNLETFYHLGVRMIGLTWNYPNEIGYPNIDLSKPKEQFSLEARDQSRGLTSFGKSVVQKMNALGMIVDVSHLSDAGVEDVLAISTKPIVASHSCAQAICDVGRNLSDKLIQKIHENGGVIGINYASDFVAKKAKDAIGDIVDHIEHMVKIASINVVALGSDFDGIDTPKGLKDASYLSLLETKLQERKFSKLDIEKIMYRNFLRVFKAVCK